MSKIIYLESTLNLIIETQGIETAKELIESGTLKQTDNLLNYLVITD